LYTPGKIDEIEIKTVTDTYAASNKEIISYLYIIVYIERYNSSSWLRNALLPKFIPSEYSNSFSKNVLYEFVRRKMNKNEKVFKKYVTLYMSFYGEK